MEVFLEEYQNLWRHFFYGNISKRFPRLWMPQPSRVSVDSLVAFFVQLSLTVLFKREKIHNFLELDFLFFEQFFLSFHKKTTWPLIIHRYLTPNFQDFLCLLPKMLWFGGNFQNLTEVFFQGTHELGSSRNRQKCLLKKNWLNFPR